jgi:lipopolysaccharide transport system ATP-binding protein
VGAAVQVTGIGKLYRLGRKANRFGSLTEAIRATAGAIRHGRAPLPTLWALRDVSFDVQAGEVLGIIGRNGAGKSTLLKILSRLTEPTEGRAVIDGRLGSLLEVGTGFHAELTGRENVYLNAAILGMRRAEVDRKFDQIVEFSGVEAFLDTAVKHYSSGMYVRLAFAVAAHLEPDILIVDEVLSVGDAAFQRKCLGKMGEVASEGRTVLFVSHNMPVIKSLCTRAVLIDGGRLVEDGDTDAVVATYLRTDETPIGESQLSQSDSLMGTGEVRLRWAGILERNGATSRSLHFAEPLRVKMRFEVLDEVPDGVIEVGVSTLDGQRVATMTNTDNGGHAFKLEPGLQEVLMEADVTLLPRDYVLHVSIHKYSGTTIDLVDNVTRFSVINVALDGGDHYRPHEVRGYVRPSTRWQTPRAVG